jgi:hypothetical protein
MLYANGLMLFAGPFRDFREPTTQMFLKDVHDGYFPYELKERFPDGVPFAVTDRRHTPYGSAPGATAADPASVAAKSTGYVLGGGGVPSRLVATTASGAASGATTTTTAAGTTVAGTAGGTAALLARLPPTVVHNGRLVDVRAGIAEALAGPAGRPPTVRLLESPAVAAMRRPSEDRDGADGAPAPLDLTRPQTPADITTLRVRPV